MQAFEKYHDKSEKVLLKKKKLKAEQSAKKDIKKTIDF